MIKNPRFEEIKDPEALITVLVFLLWLYIFSLAVMRDINHHFYHTNINLHSCLFLLLVLTLLKHITVYLSFYNLFIVNYYEVNIILGKYLDLWNKNKDLSYVRLSTFMTTYNVFNTGIIDKFFPNGILFIYIIFY